MLSVFNERGYIVKETGAVYYSQNLDKTLRWFNDVLGWYGQIEVRDENNHGTYGCLCNIPMDIQMFRISPFTGIHLYKGQAQKGIVGFMLVQGIENLYTFVKKNGWNHVTEIVSEPWGGKTCEVVTIDGSILKFFEPITT